MKYTTEGKARGQSLKVVGEVSKQEEYQRKYDDYYQDANNMIF